MKTLKRIVRSYEQMQGPKFVIALGICPVNGGMYWDSYNTINRLDQYIPVVITSYSIHYTKLYDCMPFARHGTGTEPWVN